MLRSRKLWAELVVVFVAFVALDLARIRSALPHPQFGDEWRYLYYAENLLHGFYSPRDRVFLWNGPGYPLLILPFVELGWIDGARYCNAFWHAGMLAYAWALLRTWWSAPWCALAVIALGLYQPLARHLPLLYTEVLCCFLLTAWLYHAVCAERSALQRIVAGAYLGALCMTKVVFGVGLLAFMLLLLAAWRWRRGPMIAGYLQLSVLAFALCTPYLAYTQQLTGRWLYWSSAPGNNFYWLTSPYREESGDWYHHGWVRDNPLLHAHHGAIFARASGLADDPNLSDREQLFNLSRPEASDILLQAGLRNVRKRPLKFLRNYLANLSRLFFDVPTSVRGTPLVNPASAWNLPLLLWTAAVIAHARRRRAPLPRALWPGVTFALLTLAACTLSALDARFLIPFVPLWWLTTWLWLGAARERLAS